jgi:hypothetical protein
MKCLKCQFENAGGDQADVRISWWKFKLALRQLSQQEGSRW